MGSTNRKLVETIKLIDGFKKAIKSVAQDSEYNRGMYNGIELMNSMMTNLKPDLIEKKVGEKEIENEKSN